MYHSVFLTSPGWFVFSDNKHIIQFHLLKGAFTPKHIYSPDVVQEILQHARLRGVRVIPEFDTPGKFVRLNKELAV